MAEDQPEFCHLLNATSSFLHHLETFLNKAVRQSRKELDVAAHPALATDVSMFCAQEGRDATVSNVPGPKKQLYFAGAPIETIISVGPIIIHTA